MFVKVEKNPHLQFDGCKNGGVSIAFLLNMRMQPALLLSLESNGK